MKRFLPIISIVAVVVSFCSCGDKEEAGPAIYVEPESLILNFESGDQAEFEIRAVAGDNELRQIKILQKPEGGITTTLKDTIVYGSQAEFFYVYNVPTGSSRILLTFTAVDIDGKNVSTLRDLYVESADFLSETTGHELFSTHNFGSNNAMHIADLTYLQMDTDPDSAMVDIFERDETNDGAISRNISSLSNIRFVRNNSFNYAEASSASAMNSYTSSVPQQLITNVQVNDILITEYDTIQHKYAVIKFTGVFDDVDPELDRYIFNIKK